MLLNLTIETLKKAALEFCNLESIFQNQDLYGVTDGKAVGTFIEHKFQKYLDIHYWYEKGSSAKGIYLPGSEIETDIKVTSIRQPQSSCPFRDVKQKIFGLGYNLLVFVYDKTDDPKTGFAKLDFVSCTFLEKERTADYSTTFRLREMIKDGAIKEDIVGYLIDQYVDIDDIGLNSLAEDILTSVPQQGYWISNPFQWQFPYKRTLDFNEPTKGVFRILEKVMSF